MKKILFVLGFGLMVVFSYQSFADDDFMIDDPYPSQGQSDELRFNPPENTWHYESPDSELQYNPMEKKWDYVEPGEQLKFNPMENEWEYAK